MFPTLRSRQLFFGVLCAMVVFVQTLGLVHRVAHVFAMHAGGSVQSQSQALPEVPGISLADTAPDLLSVWFGGHQDLSKCQSLEHVGSSTPVSGTPALAKPVAFAEIPRPPALVHVPGGDVRHYRSRAPPHSV